MNCAAPSDPMSGPASTATDSSADDGRVMGSGGEDLSAWLDGEVDDPAAELLMVKVLASGDDRRRFEQWCLVGDALRSQEVAAGHSPRLCARIADALKAEPVLLAPRALPARRRRPSTLTRHIASGVAVAAAAAVVVFFALPQLRGGVGAVPSLVAQVAAPAAQPGAAVALATVPPGASPSAQHNPRLDPYIEAHRDFSGAGVMPAAAVYLRFGNEGEP